VGLIFLFYFVPQKFIIILSFFVKQISAFYFYALNTGYLIEAAFGQCKLRNFILISDQKVKGNLASFMNRKFWIHNCCTTTFRVHNISTSRCTDAGLPNIWLMVFS